MWSLLTFVLGLASLAAAEDGAGALLASQQPLDSLDSRDSALPVLVVEVADVPSLVAESLLTPHAGFVQQGSIQAMLRSSMAKATRDLEQFTGLPAADVLQTLSDIQAFRLSITPMRNGEPIGRMEGSLTLRFTDLDAALDTFLRMNTTTEAATTTATALKQDPARVTFQGVVEPVLFERNGQLLSVRPLEATLSDTPFDLDALAAAAATDGSSEGSDAEPSKEQGAVASAIRARVFAGAMLPPLRQQLARDLPPGMSVEILETLASSFEALIHWDLGDFGISELIRGDVDEARLRAVDWQQHSAAVLEGLRSLGALDDNDIRAIEQAGTGESGEGLEVIALPPPVPVDRSAFEQLPSDTLMAAAWTMQNVGEDADVVARSVKIGSALQQSPLQGEERALMEELQVLWVRLLMSCEGQAAAYVRSGLGLPTATLALPLANETIATELVELLAAKVPNAAMVGPDVEIATGKGITLSVGWREGAGIIATTHPLGVESHFGNTGGFLADPELQALLEDDVSPADETRFLALSRGAPVVAALAPMASMLNLVPPSTLAALQKAAVPGFVEGRVDGSVRSQGLVSLALFPLGLGAAAGASQAGRPPVVPPKPMPRHNSAEL